MAADERLILASASPRRRELLATIVADFELCVCPLREPEDKPDGVTPRAWAEALAYFKARAVALGQPHRWVLGADTVVACTGKLLGKPANLDDARRMLRLQAGRMSEVITGVCLVSEGMAVRRAFHTEITRVWMRSASAETEAYLESGDWQGKAGAYGIQDVGDRLVERIEGSFSNVVGLPLEALTRMLRAVPVLRVQLV